MHVCVYVCMSVRCLSLRQYTFAVGDGDGSREDGDDFIIPVPLTTPAVRKIAQEMGLDLHLIEGSGPGGRILKEDLMNDSRRGRGKGRGRGETSEVVYINEVSADPYSNADLVHEKSSSVSSSVSSVYREEEGKGKGEGERRTVTVPLRGLQRLMARSMTESLKVPQLCYSDDINCDQLLLIREGMKKSTLKKEKGRTASPSSSLQPNNASPSILPLIIKATSLALKKHPIMNCSVHCAECSEIVYNDDHNIGERMIGINVLSVLYLS